MLCERQNSLSDLLQASYTLYVSQNGLWKVIIIIISNTPPEGVVYLQTV